MARPVVLGRGGVAATADTPDATHVLLTGPRDRRVARVAEREGSIADERCCATSASTRSRRASTERSGSC